MLMFVRFSFLFVSLSLLSGCSVLQQWFVAKPCQDPVYRQFDFWIGEWDVAQAEGEKPKAFNSITPIVQGCALKERYHTQSGYTGESLNWYDPQLQQWRQTWVDNAGMVLHLAGGLNAQGEMVLRGDHRRDERGEPILDRITWTPTGFGDVIQLWQTSTDDGKTWQQLFKGIYQARQAPVFTPRQRY